MVTGSASCAAAACVCGRVGGGGGKVKGKVKGKGKGKGKGEGRVGPLARVVAGVGLGGRNWGGSSARVGRVGVRAGASVTAERPQEEGGSRQGLGSSSSSSSSALSSAAARELLLEQQTLRVGGVDAEEAVLIETCDARHAQYVATLRQLAGAVEAEAFGVARELKEEAEGLRRGDVAVGFAGALRRAVSEERYGDADLMQRDKRGRAVRDLIGYWRAQGEGQGGVLDMRGKLVCVEAGMAHGRLVGSVVSPDGEGGAGSKVPVFEVFVFGGGDAGAGEHGEGGSALPPPAAAAAAGGEAEAGMATASAPGSASVGRFVVRSLVAGADGAEAGPHGLLMDAQREHPSRHPSPLERRRAQLRRRRRDAYVLEVGGGAASRDTAGLRLPDVWVESDDELDAGAQTGELFSAAQAAGLVRSLSPSYRARKGTTRPVGSMLCKRCRSVVADASGHALPSSARKARVDHLSKTAPSRPFLLRFKNGLGVEADILTMGHAVGAGTSPQDDGPTTRFSWFRGYGHRPVYCNGCANHVGWRYTPEAEPQPETGGGSAVRGLGAGASGLLAAVGIGKKRVKPPAEAAAGATGLEAATASREGGEDAEAFFGLLYDALVEDSGDAEGSTQLWQKTLLTRVPTPAPPSSSSSSSYLAPSDVLDLEGLYVGVYGAHGNEIVSLECRGDELVATKITGDGNVPSGEVSFAVSLGSDARLPHQGFFPDDWGVVGRFQGKGQVAGQGFSDPRWVEGELLLFNQARVGQNQLSKVRPAGADFGFLFNMGLERSLIVFSELPVGVHGTADLTGQDQPLAIREDMPDLYLDLAESRVVHCP